MSYCYSHLCVIDGPEVCFDLSIVKVVATSIVAARLVTLLLILQEFFGKVFNLLLGPTARHKPEKLVQNRLDASFDKSQCHCYVPNLELEDSHHLLQ